MNEPIDKLAEKLLGPSGVRRAANPVETLAACTRLAQNQSMPLRARVALVVALSCQSFNQSMARASTEPVLPVTSNLVIASKAQATTVSPQSTFSQSIIPSRSTEASQPIVATTNASTQLQQQSTMQRSTLAKSAALECQRKFHRAQESVDIRVVAPSDHGQLTIQVLDTDGKSLGDLGVTPGIVDVHALVPAIDDLAKSAWIQLFQDGKPVGSPLVLEPLRSPPSVRTMRAQRKGSNDPYTRIVGWGDRLLDPTDQEVMAASSQWIASEPIVLSGFRTEPDVDAMVMTDAGPIRIAFTPDAAPATVRNFVTLAEQGFYNNTIFHRIVPMNRDGQPFVIQGGDPTGTGDGGPGWNLALEPSDLPHDLGVVGMARGDDPNSAGSQFYIALSRSGTARLDGQYCAFGYVVSGRDALKKIADSNIADSATGRPSNAPNIQQVMIIPAPPRVPGENRRAQRIQPEAIIIPDTTTSPQTR